ncbi:hypothetical protein ONZ51_g7179 [Trametes cubensis]|uniref:DRBM domain-containing protein n=1 Tax=Trametes cubensis TaxID=1111947 RepID=A0AAD7X9U6_9APHY|nr:hypothetical protein ONZ51_g7179 [Trametes cubensis]
MTLGPLNGHNAPGTSAAAAQSDSGTCTSPSAPAKSHSPSPNLKRSRSASLAMDPDLPPAPKIDGEAMLEVFVHKSMKFPGAPLNNDSPYGDSDRLAALGHKILEAAYTDVLFSQRPMLKAEDMKQQVETKLQELVQAWVEGYRWREKVRYVPGSVDLKDPEETRRLFDSYVGAVFIGEGFQSIRRWVGALVDPKAQSTSMQAQQGLHSEPELKRPKVEPAAYGGLRGGYMPSAPPFQGQPPMYPQPPQTYFPPAPPLPPPPLPPSTPQPHSAFLPLFNQTAQQRRLEVTYPAQFTGPPHAGRWTVQCVVNGIERGVGSGTSKQLAKEEAARQAYHAMGWAPYS